MVDLRTWYETVYAPTFLVGARPATFLEYRSTLSRWEQLTKDPGLEEIDTMVLAAFQEGLLSMPRSRATVNKHLRQVEAVLGKAGPPGPRNRDALGVIHRAPWVKPLKEFRRLPRAIDVDQVAALYNACRFATQPAGLGFEPPDWWRALVVLAFTTGFRRGSLLSLPWKSIDLVAREIRIEAEDDKCGRERLKPLHAVAIRHVLRIRVDEDLVFPWPFSRKTWYRHWQRLQAADDVDPPIRLHDLKRAAVTTAAAMATPHTVQRFADHSQISTSQWYVNPAKELRELVDAFPIPDCFRRDGTD
ncbi:MAG: tyrosine-type recombinase/integrase [Planctomycetes bacterium]|nr:tyrosine-type recombinase/integrase [Planctomycetota bacterium]